jgi:peroxiredoxin Q/BCP
VVLYFYPEDDTPGCTTQACGFRDDFPRFEDMDAVILGVSPDSVDSHRRFKKKFRLPFQLLSDPDHKIATRYGVWGERELYGQTFVGMTRATFIVDANGRVASVHRNVRTEGHARRMIEALAQVQPDEQ